jgi:SNF2 family DNA or RNA helicase
MEPPALAEDSEAPPISLGEAEAPVAKRPEAPARKDVAKRPSAFDALAPSDPYAGLNREDPTEIVKFLTVQHGATGVDFALFRKVYRGERQYYSVSDLLDAPGLCLDLEKRLVLDSRFYAGDLVVKRKAYREKARAESNLRIKEKWEKQATLLEELMPRRDGFGVTYGLRQRWIPREYVKEFFLENHFRIYETSQDKVTLCSYDAFTHNLNRYLSSKSLTGATDSKWAHMKRIERLEADFNDWLHAHPASLDLAELYNCYFNSYVPARYEADPLDIDRFLSGELTLHPYQRAEIRRLAAEGRGICAYGVGLGKTLIALGLYAWGTLHRFFQKTLIVVPASVLASWDQECRRFFTPSFYEREIFVVGLGTQGSKKGSFDPSKARADMKIALEGDHSLVIMTKEKFAALRLREENRLGFANYILKFCPHSRTLLSTFAAGDRDSTKDRDWPYFEDFGFDNVIFDEAHVFKNSLSCSFASSRIAYLASPVVSSVALNAIAKSHYIRSQNQNRGVFGLTATPVTNSPFEIFNMLSLVTDLSVFVSMGVSTIDEIIKVFGKVNVQGTVRVSGEFEQREALMGFVNLDGLRTLFNRFVHFENGAFVRESFSGPAQAEFHELVPLAPDQELRYQELRNRALSLEKGDRGWGNYLANMLSIIRDMDRLTVDEDSLERQSTFILPNLSQAVFREFVAKLPLTWEISVLSEETGLRTKETVSMSYPTRRTDEGHLSVKIPEDMDDLAVKILSELGFPESEIRHPLNPKYEALLVRMRGYLEAGGKQLVFTEEKTQHRKLKRIIASNLGLGLAEVGVINAEESSGYRLEKTIRDYNYGRVVAVVANRKAELGVNLQHGTTAIHHLTLPWTPASVQQRNGRGVRQGNLANEVAVHYYFGEKTFDKYRHAILQAKSNWIGELLSGDSLTLANGEAPDLEELFDLLANSPEKAQERRRQRQEAAMELYLAKQREGLLGMLRTMTVLHAQNVRGAARRKKKGVETEMSQPKEVAVVKDLEERLLDLIGRQGDALPYKARVEDLKRKICSDGYSENELSDMRAELRDLLARGSDPRKGERLRTIERLRVELSQARGRLAKIRKTRDALTAEENAIWERDAKYLEQNRVYLAEMNRDGKLPFDLSLLDNLGEILVTPRCQIVKVGELYYRPEEEKLFKVAKVFPENKTVKLKSELEDDPKASRSVKAAEIDDWEKTTAAEFGSRKAIRYGLIPSGSLSREEFERDAAHLLFERSRGLVCHKDGEMRVYWDESEPLEEGALPVYPEPRDPEFCYEVCLAWLNASAAGAEPPAALMEDLFGENFRTLAYSFSEAPSLGMMGLKEN